VVLVTVLVSSIVTRSAARRIEPPPVQAERLAENVFVPVDVVDDRAVIELAARIAMAKGGNVLVGAVAAAGGAPLEDARDRATAAERQASTLGAEASSVVRVDQSEAAAIAAIAAEHGVTLMVTGWRRAAVAADVVLGGQALDLVALADVPVLAVLAARGEYRRVVLALDAEDLSDGSERDLAVACASVAAAATSGRALVLVPEDDAAPDLGGFAGDAVDVVVDRRPRLEAVAALAREDDLVLVPGRAGRSPLHRDAAALAALPVSCSVAVSTRPHAGAGLVTGTTTLVGSRRSS
jgi:hypothetical protein